MTRRTGAAATRNPDNIAIYRLVVALLIAASAAGLVGSVDGLLHAASWAFAPHLQWTLPTAVDVFLVGCALATLALRERRAYFAAGFCALVTLALVTFSSTVNFLYWKAQVALQVLAGEIDATGAQVGPWIKAAMPVLLLIALEILAAMTSTRNNRANSPLNRAKADVKKHKAEAAALRKQLKSRVVATAVPEIAPLHASELGETS